MNIDELLPTAMDLKKKTALEEAAMAAAEITGIPHWALWAGGSCLLIGRVMHAVTLIAVGWGNPRALGMILTFLPMVGFGVWAVYKGVFSALPRGF